MTLDSKAIIAEWTRQFEKEMGPEGLAVRNWPAYARTEVWLGGPGKSSKLFVLRDLLRMFLEQHGHTVVYAEDLRGPRNVILKEERQVRQYLPLILVVSPGPAAEAMWFARLASLKDRMRLFVPENFKDGFVHLALDDLRCLNRHSWFPLSQEKLTDEAWLKEKLGGLAISVLEAADTSEADPDRSLR